VGVSKEFLRFFWESIDLAKINIADMRVAEIGNQHFLSYDCEENMQLRSLVVKDYFQTLGIGDVSFDITGWDGSLPYDLTKPVPTEFHARFNVLLNGGTTEHIDNQYSCFLNLHNMQEVGGIAVHEVPLVGYWPHHCNWYYGDDFFKDLCQTGGYEVLHQKKIWYDTNGFALASTIKKVKEAPFISASAFQRHLFYQEWAVQVDEYWKPFLGKQQ
jgi:hypothetical protein